MLNLLFISDNPKIEHIKNVLQPVLRVIIDIVPDFDHGLKDVFEKRPATVCIQDQIAGVSGERVARHIQMLLGSGAPTFILIHEGSGKANQIKGLFEYIVDLNQPEAKLAEEITRTLKILIGDQWNKIFIPPKQKADSISSPALLPDQSRTDADKLVDDFLSDLETTGFSVVSDSASVLRPEDAAELTGLCIAENTADELAEMLLEQSKQARQAEIAAEKPAPDQDTKSEEVPETHVPLPPPTVDTIPLSAMPDKSEKSARTGSTVSKPKQAAAPAAGQVDDSPAPAVAAPEAAPVVSAPVSQPTPVVPAAFHINHGKLAAQERVPDDLPLNFDDIYRSESRRARRLVIAAAVLLCIVAIAGWYFVKRTSGVPKQRAIPVAKPTPVPAVNQQLSAAQPAPTEQKPAQATIVKPAAPPLPTFIPRDGHDTLFAAQNPGWERYIGRQIEFRVFSAGEKLRAVQILATAGNVIPDALVKTVLTELAGSADYRISSRETKSGFLVLRGSVVQKADVLFYKRGSKVRAFVVSLY